MVFLLYLKAVGKHWWALMSCAAFTMLGLYIAHANKGNDWVVKGIFALAGGLLFVACFLAWRDEHDKLLVERHKNEGSRIEGKMIAALADFKRHLNEGSFQLLTEGCYVTVLVAATNVNPAPAYLETYATSLSIALNGKVYRGEYVPLPTGHIDFIANVDEIQNGNIYDFFAATFQAFPMNDGVPHGGWLRFFVGGMEQATLSGKEKLVADLRLTLTDTRKKTHTIEQHLPLQLDRLLHRSEIKRL
jgi:hypothetical protein